MRPVSNVDVSTGQTDFTAEVRRKSCRRAAPPSLFPLGGFGLRAAMLAGVVVVAAAPVPSANPHARARDVATTVMLAGPLSGLAGSLETTCCPENDVALFAPGAPAGQEAG
jgi:hypothetical protein